MAEPWERPRKAPLHKRVLGLVIWLGALYVGFIWNIYGLFILSKRFIFHPITCFSWKRRTVRPAVLDNGPWTHEYKTINGVRLHYATAGKGDLMLFLHGFPEGMLELLRPVKDTARWAKIPLIQDAFEKAKNEPELNPFTKWPKYSDAREAVQEAMQGTTQVLASKFAADIGGVEVGALILAIFRELHCCRLSNVTVRTDVLLAWFSQPTNLKGAKAEDRALMVSLVKGKFDPQSWFNFSPKTPLRTVMYASAAIHAACFVLRARYEGKQTVPEGWLLRVEGPQKPQDAQNSQPGALHSLFIPGAAANQMADMLAEIRANGSGTEQLYVCRKGHPYVIGDCGRAWVQSKYPECHETIGGFWHFSVNDTKLIDAKSVVLPGLMVTSIAVDTDPFAKERDLSPGPVRLLRILLHGLLAVGAATGLRNDTNGLITGKNYPSPVTMFQEHFQHNWAMLSKIASINSERVALLVHAALYESEAQHFDGPPGGHTENKDRIVWENRVQEQLQKTLSVPEVSCSTLERVLRRTDQPNALAESIGRDATQGDGNRLYRLRSTVDVNTMLSHLHAQPGEAAKYPALVTICSNAAELVALQYLPSMLEWQHNIIENNNRRWKLEQAASAPMWDQCKGKAKFESLARDFESGWNAVYSHIKQNWIRVREDVPEMVCARTLMIDGMEAETARLIATLPVDSLDYILPRIVIQYMVTRHNQLVDVAYARMTQGNKGTDAASQATAELIATVPLYNMVKQDAIIIKGPADIGPLLYRHCRQSLEYNKGTELDFDFAAIEADLISRFLMSKPYVGARETANIKQRYLEFLDDPPKSLMDEVRALIEQQTIPDELARAILGSKEVKENHLRLKELLSLCLHCMRQTGGKPETKLVQYITDTVTWNDEHKHLAGVLEHVMLLHVVSLDDKYDRKFRSNRHDELPQIFRVKLPDDVKNSVTAYATQMLQENHLTVLQEYVDALVDHIVNAKKADGAKTILVNWLLGLDTDEYELKEATPWILQFPASVSLAHLFDTVFVLRDVRKTAMTT